MPVNSPLGVEKLLNITLQERSVQGDWQSDRESLPSALHRFVRPPQNWVDGSGDFLRSLSTTNEGRHKQIQGLLALTRLCKGDVLEEAAPEARCTTQPKASALRHTPNTGNAALEHTHTFQGHVWNVHVIFMAVLQVPKPSTSFQM